MPFSHHINWSLAPSRNGKIGENSENTKGDSETPSFVITGRRSDTRILRFQASWAPWLLEHRGKQLWGPVRMVAVDKDTNVNPGQPCQAVPAQFPLLNLKLHRGTGYMARQAGVACYLQLLRRRKDSWAAQETF